MVILIEGCDCTGKSTLIKERLFKPEQNPRIIHHGAFPTPTDAFQAYERLLDPLNHTHETTAYTLIMDRMHISERIYGRIFHNKWMSDDRYEYLEYLLEKLQTVVVFCKPPLEKVLSTWRSRQDDEMIKDVETIRNIYLEYSKLDLYTGLPVIEYDWTIANDRIVDINEKIVEIRNKAYGYIYQ